MHDVSHAARPSHFWSNCRHHPVPEKTWFACIENGLLKVHENVILTNIKNKFWLKTMRFGATARASHRGGEIH